MAANKSQTKNAAQLRDASGVKVRFEPGHPGSPMTLGQTRVKATHPKASLKQFDQIIYPPETHLAVLDPEIKV